MKCPNDNAVLVMSDRQGVEIDYCPQCRGVWLDRGELDKIIERTGANSSTSASQGYSAQPSQHDDRRVRRDDYRDEKHAHKKRKKENFLEDLFDF